MGALCLLYMFCSSTTDLGEKSCMDSSRFSSVQLHTLGWSRVPLPFRDGRSGGPFDMLRPCDRLTADSHFVLTFVVLIFERAESESGLSLVPSKWIDDSCVTSDNPDFLALPVASVSCRQKI
jgi:hypothetical protein